MQRNSRYVIVSLLVISCLVVSGCTESGVGDDPGNAPEGSVRSFPNINVTPVARPDIKNQIEILTWWTGAGDEAGFRALLQLFKQEHPDIYLFSAAVEGGAGVNARDVLKRRMEEGNPPDTYQANEETIIRSASQGQLASLNDLFDEEGWKDKFPKEIIDELTLDGNIYAIPLNIHRTNVLWYNKKIFKQLDLEPPGTFEELLELCRRIRDAGIVPLASGDKTEISLLNNVILGTIGTDRYLELTRDEALYDDSILTKVYENMKELMSYVNADHGNLSWSEEAKLFGEGQTAMLSMGDWVKGNLSFIQEMIPGEDYGWVTFPGTKGTFLATMDTFGLPKASKNPETTKEWLKLLGSVEGQDTFNPLKGSIPSRIDTDSAKYDAYGQQTIKDFKESLKHSRLIFKSVGRQVYQGYLEAKKIDS
ncbi:ABC transporter substrate-binding protein [Paenibacillus sp. LHD-117]|uniref:ABC transporter substrate-binding protein n=1 Tax=Paenibacillus sp. LHD-117 TaxID=3071412 RepID=UPI0027E133F3|nr:ABC transporter substrate-binding protein [Paenibacillus sp. LHD-117]MDQ6419667.1 ABC transporter substrate-binding protein [Paenibacillus sp. LHD-117]